MTTCGKCGNSYSDGFDDVHSCPDPERERLVEENRRLQESIERMKKRHKRSLERLAR
jgi:hypothetical protein